MKKVKVFFGESAMDFEDDINSFLMGILHQETIEIKYSTGAIGADFMFTAMIFYEE